MKPFRSVLHRAQPRPAGAGAFWDYAAAFARLHDTAAAQHARASVRLARRSAELEAEQRWDGEGGSPWR